MCCFNCWNISNVLSQNEQDKFSSVRFFCSSVSFSSHFCFNLDEFEFVFSWLKSFCLSFFSSFFLILLSSLCSSTIFSLNYSICSTSSFNLYISFLNSLDSSCLTFFMVFIATESKFLFLARVSMSCLRLFRSPQFCSKVFFSLLQCLASFFDNCRK